MLGSSRLCIDCYTMLCCLQLQRGYVPSFIYSCHYLTEPNFAGVVQRCVLLAGRPLSRCCLRCRLHALLVRLRGMPQR